MAPGVVVDDAGPTEMKPEGVGSPRVVPSRLIRTSVLRVGISRSHAHDQSRRASLRSRTHDISLSLFGKVVVIAPAAEAGNAGLPESHARSHARLSSGGPGALGSLGGRRDTQSHFPVLIQWLT